MYSNIQNIYIIIGLPGSGKTTYAKQLLSPSAILIDDFFVIYSSTVNLPWTTKIKNDTKNIIITDCHCCIEAYQKKLNQLISSFFPNANITWIMFENNKEKALYNSKHRKNYKSVAISTQIFSEYYYIHKKCTIVKPIVLVSKNLKID